VRAAAWVAAELPGREPFEWPIADGDRNVKFIGARHFAPECGEWTIAYETSRDFPTHFDGVCRRAAHRRFRSYA